MDYDEWKTDASDWRDDPRMIALKEQIDQEQDLDTQIEDLE